MAKMSTTFFIITIMLAVFLSAPTLAQVEESNVGSCKVAGEFCGGFAGFACCKGLTCVLEGTFPDAGGVCKRKY